MAAQDISNGRPTALINGVAQEPIFTDALAYWKCNDTPFTDSNENFVDFSSALGTRQIHPLFGNRLWRGYATGSISVSDALLRLTGDLTLHFFMGQSAPAGRFDLQCYSTGDSDCLFGVGHTSGNFRVWDKSLSGGWQYTLYESNILQPPFGRETLQIFAVRSGTAWKLYAQGELISTVSGASTNTPAGDEVFVISSTSVNNSFSHVALWNSALSATRIRSEYKRAFGR